MTATCSSPATAARPGPMWSATSAGCRRTPGFHRWNRATSMPATVYATFDLHAFGDMRPYSYKSADYGKTWEPLVVAGGTGPGLRARDQGGPGECDCSSSAPRSSWSRSTAERSGRSTKGGNFPAVAVRDLAIHPRDHDLVIATHGRGMWIIDDITPLRTLTPAVLSANAAFVEGRPVEQRIPAFGGWVNGDASFVGPESARRCGDYVLPAEAPHLRRHDAGGVRFGRQTAGHAADRQTSRPEPGDVVDANATTARAVRSLGRGRRVRGTAAASGNLHVEDDQGAGESTRRSSP